MSLPAGDVAPAFPEFCMKSAEAHSITNRHFKHLRLITMTTPGDCARIGGFLIYDTLVQSIPDILIGTTYFRTSLRCYYIAYYLGLPSTLT